jgi:tripartite-type tricarboxylate transporter receptor subunit TctC
VIEAAKREPGKLSYGTWGVGSTHLLMLEMNERTGADAACPFGGPAPALTRSWRAAWT